MYNLILLVLLLKYNTIALLLPKYDLEMFFTMQFLYHILYLWEKWRENSGPIKETVDLCGHVVTYKRFLMYPEYTATYS